MMLQTGAEEKVPDAKLIVYWPVLALVTEEIAGVLLDKAQGDPLQAEPVSANLSIRSIPVVLEVTEPTSSGAFWFSEYCVHGIE